ncbi:MAG TPA: sigma-70 family RNA polymerase sigma factor [Verrucomicrobiales bacterium]|nr:sigma-70 family RNA polymerase sigma factor [Verrucomicrobiales bacterium]
MENLAHLAAAARSNQPGAFAALVTALQPGIFQITGRFARNHHDFGDLSQEICLRLWKSLPALRDTIAFPAWFRSLAVRTCYDWLRRRRSRQDHEVSREQLADTPDLPDEPPGEEDAVNPAAERVYTALAQLKPAARLVLTLLELEEHTIEEVAALTGWSSGNVRVRAHRARAALRRALSAPAEPAG